MQFIHTHELVLSGRKTQTRRIVKDGDYGWMVGRGYVVNPVTGREPIMYSEVLNQKGEVIRLRWQREATYAVCPGRGKKAVGRIQITGIRREDVRNISFDDVAAEGFSSFAEFIHVWVKMHSPHDMIYWTSSCCQEYWQSCTRDSDPAKYSAWVLEFRLVEPAAP